MGRPQGQDLVVSSSVAQEAPTAIAFPAEPVMEGRNHFPCLSPPAPIFGAGEVSPPHHADIAWQYGLQRSARGVAGMTIWPRQSHAACREEEVTMQI